MSGWRKPDRRITVCHGPGRRSDPVTGRTAPNGQPVAIEKSRQGKREALEKVYALFVVNEPRQVTDTEVADLVRRPKQDVRNLRMDLSEVGSLTFRRYPAGGNKGWANEWTLVDDLETARRKLNAKWVEDDRLTDQRAQQMYKNNSKRQIGQPKGTVIRQASLSEVVRTRSRGRSRWPLGTEP
jgi:hypothetical protein